MVVIKGLCIPTLLREPYMVSVLTPCWRIPCHPALILLPQFLRTCAPSYGSSRMEISFSLSSFFPFCLPESQNIWVPRIWFSNRWYQCYWSVDLISLTWVGGRGNGCSLLRGMFPYSHTHTLTLTHTHISVTVSTTILPPSHLNKLHPSPAA